MKYPDLKEDISAHLKRNPDVLDMRHFIVPLTWRLSVYNFTGLILLHAGYSLQISNGEVRLPLNAPHLDKKWVQYERETGFCPPHQIEIPALARQIWEENYGELLAKELPFYEDVKAKGCWWWDNLKDVTANNLRLFLAGDKEDMPYNINGPYEGDE